MVGKTLHRSGLTAECRDGCPVLSSRSIWHTRSHQCHHRSFHICEWPIAQRIADDRSPFCSASYTLLLNRSRLTLLVDPPMLSLISNSMLDSVCTLSSPSLSHVSPDVYLGSLTSICITTVHHTPPMSGQGMRQLLLPLLGSARLVEVLFCGTTPRS